MAALERGAGGFESDTQSNFHMFWSLSFYTCAEEMFVVAQDAKAECFIQGWKGLEPSNSLRLLPNLNVN